MEADAAGLLEELSSPAPKRSRRNSQLHNGYNCIFTKEPPEHLQIECSICLAILHEPQLIDCHCGSSFCQSCILPIQIEGKPCPLCKGPFAISMPDRRLQRTLNNLSIHCSFKEAGCEWVGELSKLNEHLNSNPLQDTRMEGCSFIPIECTFCKGEFQRQFVSEHEYTECPKRPSTCEFCNEYESTFEDVTMNHASICPSRLVDCPNECGEAVQRKELDAHLSNTCPLEVISCYAGCEERLPRRDMATHINENLASHLTLQAVKHHQQSEKLESKIQELERENLKLKQELDILRSEHLSLHAHLQIVPLYLTMGKFSTKLVDEEEWTSHPFYTHPRGYKMCLNVDPYGVNIGEGTHISVFLKLMRGPFDNHLSWPFRGSITVMLLDQSNGGDDHRAKTINFNESTPEECTRRVAQGEKCNEGWGFSRFIAHRKLYTKYLKRDTLHFKVSHVGFPLVGS